MNWMRTFQFLLIVQCLVASMVQAQDGFICQLPERHGVYAEGGARMSFAFPNQGSIYQVERFEDSLIMVRDTLGNIIRDKLKSFAVKPSGLIVIQNFNDKWGVLRSDLTTLIADEYDDLFFETIGPGFGCLVKKNRHWGIIDSSGNALAPLKFDRIGLVTNQMAFLEVGDAKYLYFFPSQSLVNVHGYCIQTLGRDNNTQREFLIKKDDGIGIMNVDGDTILQPKFEKIQYRAIDEKNGEAYFVFTKDGKQGVANPSGNILVPANYDRILPKNNPDKLEDAVFELQDANRLYLFYRSKISDLRFERILANNYSKNSELIFISLNRFGVYDYDLDKVLIRPKYEEIRHFNDSLYLAKKEGKFGVLSSTGKRRLGFKYEEVPTRISRNKSFPNNYFRVKQKGKFGYLNDKFETILKPRYHELKGFSEGLARVMRDYKWGYLNQNLKEQIGLKFDFAGAFKGGEAKVILGDKHFFIDAQGVCVRNCD